MKNYVDRGGCPIVVAFCVFLLSLSFHFYLVQCFKPIQSAIVALSGSAVPKALLRYVNRLIIFLSLRQPFNHFSVNGRLPLIVQQLKNPSNLDGTSWLAGSSRGI